MEWYSDEISTDDATERNLAALEKESSSKRMQKYDENISSSQVDVYSTMQPTSEMHNVLSDMTSFLMKKQLLSERFSNFDDTQESYNTWNSCWTDLLVIPNLPLMASAMRILGNLDKHWKLFGRLDEMYGRPKIVEA